MTLYNMTELIVCRFFTFIPYLILVLIPFWNSLRFSYSCTILICCITAALDSFMQIIARLTGCNGALFMFCTILYLFIILLIVKAEIGKILFSLFLMLNYAAFTAVITIYISFHGFHRLITSSSYSHLLFSSPVIAVTFLPFCLYLKRMVCPLIDASFPGIKNAWRTMWMIPAVFYGIYYYSFYADWSNSRSMLEFACKTGNVIFLLLLNFGSLIMYHLVKKFLEETAAIQKLQEENNHLSLLTKQYENLQANIEATRQARHDLRHHMVVLDRYAMKKDFESLSHYLSEYILSLPDNKSIYLCQNQAVNAVAGYYYDLAQKKQIKISFSLQLPRILLLPESDFCGALGNLLENALEACKKIEAKKRYIKVTARQEGTHILILIVENSYNGSYCEHDGIFSSSKREGSGIGLASVRALAKKYNGCVKIVPSQNLFCVNLFLNL